MRLSRKSGRFPQSLQLSHIRDLKETDLSGGFGVISRGKLNHRVVAVKKMKVGGRTPEQFLKVSNSSSRFKNFDKVLSSLAGLL